MIPNPLGNIDFNQGLKTVEPDSVEEADLAEQFMVISTTCTDNDGKLTGYRLPAPVAVLCARHALKEWRDK